MKIYAFNGSPRRNGNTFSLISHILEGAKAEDAETRLFNLFDYTFDDCDGCRKCHEEAKQKICELDDDMTTSLYQPLIEANILIIGSPIYFGYLTGKTKTFIDRLFAFLNENLECSLPPKEKVLFVVPHRYPDSSPFIQNLKPLEMYLGILAGCVGNIEFFFAGNLREVGNCMSRPDLLKQAKEKGTELARGSA